MDTTALRQKLLDLAIRGRLVPQNPDEPAIELDAEDTVPESEQPFEIPENWRWKKMRDLVQLINGDRGKNYPSKSKLIITDTGYPFVSALNLKNGLINSEGLLYVTKEQFNTLRSGKIKSDDILLCIRGSLGKYGIAQKTGGAIASSLVILRKKTSDLFILYLLNILETPLFKNLIKDKKNGTAQPNLSAKDVGDFGIPLPPLAEQKRIVAKLEQLFEVIDRCEEAQKQIADTASQLRTSLLQAAIRGKLFPQDPDEPAIELDAKDTVPESEQPFEIPENWRWVRLGNIIKLRSGEGLSKKNFKKGEYPVYGGNGLTGYHNNFNVLENTIVIGRVGYYCGNVRKTNSNTWVTDNALIVSIPENINIDYMLYLLQSLNLGKSTSQTAQPVITGKIIKPIIVSIPPLPEQKRIVSKLEQLFSIIETISNNV